MDKKHPKDYAVILWDFDGVIINSNSVREHGFREVLKNYPQEHIELLIAYHKKNGGLSRYVKFRYFFEQIRGETVSIEKINQLASKFSQMMLQELTNKEYLIDDSVFFIHESSRRGVEQYIVSGSDQDELKSLCNQLDLSKYFRSIHGSPEVKNNIVRQIITNITHNIQNVCMIGDSINDYEAAFVNNVDFFGFNNEELKTKCRCYLNSMCI